MSLTERFDLTGRTAFVTGASSGLGQHFALTLSRAGATVALAARRADRLEELSVQIAKEGGKSIPVELDVTDDNAVAPAFEIAENELGTPTILVNAAGISIGSFALDMGLDQWRQVMNVNLDSVFRVSQEAAQRMRDARLPGSIINISSILGAGVMKTLAAYATSKAAVIQLTKTMALELARENIRVNALAPGYFRTDMNEQFLETEPGKRLIARVPQGRTGSMDELEGPLLLLASDAGSFMTGSVVTVDGGALLVMG